MSGSPSASAWPESTAGRLGWVNDSRVYGRADRAQPVEQEVRVEGDLDLGAGEGRLDGLGGLGVVAGAGLDGDLAVGELQPDRGVALGDQGDALDRLDQVGGLDDRLGVDAVGKIEVTLGYSPSSRRVVARR